MTVLEAFGIVFKSFFEPGFTGHYHTLGRGPGTDLAAIGSTVEISDAFFHTDLFSNTGDTNLAFQFFPEKNKAGIRIRLQLLSLPAIVIGEKNRKDVAEINTAFIKGVRFTYVNNMDEVLDAALQKAKVKGALSLEHFIPVKQ